MKLFDSFTVPLTWLCLLQCLLLAQCLPIIDQGLFVIQGVKSCANGTGYCMLGSNCTIDIEFLPDETGGHCRGLKDAFTPKISFVCCKYNDKGKKSSPFPTTTQSSFTITDVFSLIDESLLQQQNENEIPEDIDLASLIDIVGVVTDTTGVVGLITRPWTGTVPTRYSKATTPMTLTTSVAAVTPATPLRDEELLMTTAVATQEEEVSETTLSYNEDPQNGDSTSPDEDASPESFHPEVFTPSLAEESLLQEDDFFPTEAPFEAQRSTSGVPTPTESQDEEQSDYILQDEAVVTTPSSQELTKGHRKEEDNPEPPPDILSDPLHEEEQLEAELVEGKRQDSAMSHMQESPQVGDILLTNDLKRTTPGKNELVEDYSDGPAMELKAINRNSCGKKGRQMPTLREALRKMTGGSPGSTLEWCWMSAIVEKRSGTDVYLCSAVLIEENLLVSSASCLRKLSVKYLSKYRVVLGDSNLLDFLPYGVQFHDIDRVEIHPQSDIGLVKLASSAFLKDNVCLLCVAEQESALPVEACAVTGYGLNKVSRMHSKDFQNVLSQGILRSVRVPPSPTVECRDAVRQAVADLICFQSKESRKDGICDSDLDEGSPVACRSGSKWFLAGFLSGTVDCSVQHLPQVYTRVASFTNWIEETSRKMTAVEVHRIRLM